MTENGFEGRIKTLLIDTKVFISRVRPKDNYLSPDYLVQSEHSTLGYGWDEVLDDLYKGEVAEYIRLRFDEPSFGEPFYTKLIWRYDKLVLVWDGLRHKIEPLDLPKNYITDDLVKTRIEIRDKRL